MNCACGYEANVLLMNRHRQQCSVFWESIYGAMAKIAITRYGRIVPISREEWNNYRPKGYPNCNTMSNWDIAWRQLQENSGHGVSIPGRGMAVLKGPLIQKPQWGKPVRAADYTGTFSAEYAALPPDGMAVCKRTYQRTGRMILR